MKHVASSRLTRSLVPCVALIVVVAQGCAPVRVAMAPGEDYVFPVVEDSRLSKEERLEIESAWRDVLRGNAQSAEKRFLRLLRRNPASFAIETGLAYARMRDRRLEAAASTFASVLARSPDYVPALIGAASAAVRRRKPEDALGYLRHAQGLEGARDARTDRLIRTRLAEVKLAVTEHRVAAARMATDAGQLPRAREEYRAALDAAPELTEVRLSLAELFERENDLRSAADVLLEAPRDDQQILERLGALLLKLDDPAGALAAYRRAMSLNPQSSELHLRVEQAEHARELQSMPEEYRRIQAAAYITRADLAALISVKVAALARLEPRTPGVATDITGSWAREHVIRILSYGILDVYPNHTFQPAAMVRRSELARAVARVLDLCDWPSQPAPVMIDMSPSNLYHRDASRAVAAGLLGLTRAGAFEPWRPVTGNDAVAVVEALARLVGP